MRGSNTAGLYVPPELNQAKWLLLGEAPGEDEALQGRPFVGPTGRYVDGFLQRFNFSRRDFDITNVVPYRPPKNSLMSWIHTNNEHIKKGMQELAALLAENKYEAVFALGWFALFAMTGKRGISEHRGSVYPYTVDGKVAGHVIGTYHPALMFKGGDKSVKNLTPGGIANIIFRDLAKFKRIVTEGVPVPPRRTLVLHPTQDDLRELLASVEDVGAVAIDIEVDRKTKELQLIGFATSPRYAVVISPETLYGEELVEQILAGEQDKVFHNQPFDDNYLRYHGWEVNGKLHDTMLMHHVLCPELPRDLGFCCSIYTDEPYFKALGKETGDEFKRYNALDVSTTFEIFEKLRTKLPMVGMQDTYEADRKMLDLAGRMSRRGILYDVEEAAKFKNSLEHRWKRWQAVLDGRVSRLFEWESKNATRKLDTLKFDEAVNVMSPPQSKLLLYDLMGLPEQKLKDPKTGKMKVTTQQTKLLMLYPTILDRERKKILRAFLMLRGVRKLWSSYAKTKVGKGQRMRTTLNPGAAETGRWTASAFLIDYEGTNLQTVPPPWKRCFIADEGKLLFMADYCLAPDSRVLTADLQWIPAKALREGTEIVGFDEDLSLGRRGRFRSAYVTSNHKLTQPVYEVTFSDGRVVTASAEHAWVAKRQAREYQWIWTKHLKPGMLVPDLVAPWEINEVDADWCYLGGLLDGEGWVTGGGLGFGQNDGLVLDKTLKILDDKGIQYSISRSRSGCNKVWFLGGRAAALRVLAMSDPVRFDRHSLWVDRGMYGTRRKPTAVKSVKYLGEQEVYAVGSSTRTLVVEGFLSHNSQIEARIVGYDAEDMDQIAIFEDPEGDIHKFNAARLLSIEIEDVTPHQRQYVGKSTHALNYDVGPKTLAEFTNKRGLESGIFVTVDFTREAKRLYLGTFDKVIRWQKRQWNKVKETKVLTNHLGRRRIFLGPTSGQFAYITRGETIAFVPQSDVPDMLNIAMLRLDEVDDYNMELMLQAHDAVFGQADEDSVEEWSELVKKLMTVPLTIHGREMIVPVDIKVGKRWNKLTTVRKYLELR